MEMLALMDTGSPSEECPRMETCSPIETQSPIETPSLEQLGDEIAELAAHLDAATARLLDLIREFDAREG